MLQGGRQELTRESFPWPPHVHAPSHKTERKEEGSWGQTVPCFKSLHTVENSGCLGCALSQEAPFCKNLLVPFWGWRMTWYLVGLVKSPLVWYHPCSTDWWMTYSWIERLLPYTFIKAVGTLGRIKIISEKPGPKTYLIHWTKESVQLPHLEETDTQHFDMTHTDLSSDPHRSVTWPLGIYIKYWQQTVLGCPGGFSSVPYQLLMWPVPSS